MKNYRLRLVGLLTVAKTVFADGFIVVHNPPCSLRPTTHYEFALPEVAN